jgi:hypothetical protein
MKWAIILAIAFWLSIYALVATVRAETKYPYTVTATYRCDGRWSYAHYKAKNLKQANDIKLSLTRFYKRQGRLGSVVIRVNR